METKGACYKKICGICGQTICECPCDRPKKKIFKSTCGKCSIGTKKAPAFPSAENPVDLNAPLKFKEYVVKIGDTFVYLVDADEVVLRWTTEFVMGGSWCRFSFIPKFEIWIDKFMDEFEIKDTVMHEYIESHTWDYYGGEYDKAHYATVKLEDYLYDNQCAIDGKINELLQGDTPSPPDKDDLIED